MEDRPLPDTLDDFPDQLLEVARELGARDQFIVGKFYTDLASWIAERGTPHRYDLLEWIIAYDWP